MLEDLIYAVGKLEQKVLLQNSLITKIEKWIEKNDSSMHGDVIESGGVKHITYNNYYGTECRQVAETPDAYQPLPEQLTTDKAQALKEKISKAGLIDDCWQPVNLTGPERALLAQKICDCLGIKNVWKLFGQLWNERSETLRIYFNRAMDQEKTLSFQDELKNIFN